ncbi:hypothetical protein C5471_05365 [Photorhabdus tasmaniensis]|uniref:Riboflavin biosynthesis intermediates N-glycosidase n=2 Tax=Photorhabdus tasmaniensis TaxID=1004159 RepID=A0ABX0GDM3_9GAMM|nr:hypothetical protein [Photorhabdus tasmaniensis]
MSTMSKHPFAKLMAEYAQDAIESRKPWLLWQVSYDSGKMWHDLYAHPQWVVGWEYRRKPEPVESDASKKHVHAQLMMQYAQDAMKSDEPWKRWERFHAVSWEQCKHSPAWNTKFKYRRKPEIITVGSVSFLKPISEAPALNTLCYVVAIRSNINIHSITWHNGSPMFRNFLKQGLIHLTEDAAQQHLEALIKINKGEF